MKRDDRPVTADRLAPEHSRRGPGAKRGAIFGAVILTILLLSGAPPARSQSARFDIARYSIDGGGGGSAAGRFELEGSIGQPDAGSIGGGRFQVFGGLRAPAFPERDGRGTIFLPLLRLRD